MTFILKLRPGATYGELSRHLLPIAERLSGVNMKPEGPESTELREGENVVGSWRIQRSGAGRPLSYKQRCACGAMTARRARARGHVCAEAKA